MFKNFGFMFTWKGRMIFLLFCGALAFGTGTLVLRLPNPALLPLMLVVQGIIAGIFTVVNMLFHAWVFCEHPELRELTTAQIGEPPTVIGLARR